MAFEQLQFSLASAMSWVLFAIVAILTFLNFKMQKWVNYGEDS